MVWAVKVPLTVKLSADEAVRAKDPVKEFWDQLEVPSKDPVKDKAKTFPLTVKLALDGVSVPIPTLDWDTNKAL